MKKLVILSLSFLFFSCVEGMDAPTQQDLSNQPYIYMRVNTNERTFTQVSNTIFSSDLFNFYGIIDSNDQCNIFVSTSNTGVTAIDSISVKYLGNLYHAKSSILKDVQINNAERIEGTFSGQFQKNNDPNINLSITDGSFRVIK
ncbi:MAG: hypothetical protein RLZZ500_409 [Bacteroidota bacterium]|jgi:hypothetical protein